MHYCRFDVIPTTPCSGDSFSPGCTYAYLLAVLTDPDGAYLWCGLEPDLPTFTARVAASQLKHLGPYVEILDAWRQEPDAVECPLVPIVQERTGYCSFCSQSAIYDYPELFSPVQTAP